MPRKNQNLHFREVRPFIALLAMLLVLVSGALAASEELTVEYTFASPQITEVVIGGETYQRLIMKDAPTAGTAGQPALPARGAQILLPPGTAVETIEIVLGEKHFLGSDYVVEPVGQSYPLSADPSEIRLPVPDASIYQSNAVFPPQHFEEIGTQNFRGYRILIVKLQPVEYVPTTGELYYYAHFTVVVHLRETSESPSLYRGQADDIAELCTRIDNVEVSSSYASIPQRLSDSYDLLIITTSDLVSSFQPLEDYHDTTGIPTEIRTVADIGSSDPDAVRDYIRERYLNDGIEYVLIGGDDDLIPARDLFEVIYGRPDATIPGDIYFACLDGTYNFDADAYWGETIDGEGGGEVDLIAEVYVGRASVGNATEAARFVNKTIQCLTTDVESLHKALLVGQHLGFGEIAEYAGPSLDQLIDSSHADDYSTVGIPRSAYDINKLYDLYWADNDWPVEELIERVNSGTHLVVHYGHGFVDWAMKMNSASAASSFINETPCFMYSLACDAGHFDGADCWAEYANVKNDHGPYALIMNARSGVGASYSTDAPSHRYNREFWDAIFNPHDYHPRIGRANQDSKEDNLYRIYDAHMRWCYFEINLFGDPTISIDYGQAQPALAFDFPAGPPDTIPANEETTFPVSLIKVYDGMPVPASGLLHYRIDGGALQDVPMTEVTPLLYEATLPAVMCAQVLEFYVSADEATGGRYFYPDPATPITPVVLSDMVVVFDDTFPTDKGWTVYGDATAGMWERGLPLGHGDRGDPMLDYDGSATCYLTGRLDGDTDVEGGTTYLESPVIDLSSGDALISYARWYCNDFGDNPYEDVFVISISDDNGENWTVVDTVGPEVDASGGWIMNYFWAGDFVAPTDQVKVRFAASDLGGESIVEAGIDAFHVEYGACHDCLCPGYCDLNSDEAINPVDVVFMVNYVYKSLDARAPSPLLCPGENGDWNCDDAVNPVDVVYYVNFVYKSQGTGPGNPCVD